MKRPSLILMAIANLAALACDGRVQAKFAGRDNAVSASAPTIDSILPPREALKRFQSTLTPVDELSPSIGSRDTLVARFINAIETLDTAALRRLLVSKSEYAFLYFPTSTYSRKPYELAPEIAWLLADQNNAKGFLRITRRLGGRPLAFRGYECAASVRESDNRFWRSCDVSYTDPESGASVTKKLFGPIIERGGAYKFLSYSNDF